MNLWSLFLRDICMFFYTLFLNMQYLYIQVNAHCDVVVHTRIKHNITMHEIIYMRGYNTIYIYICIYGICIVTYSVVSTIIVLYITVLRFSGTQYCNVYMLVYTWALIHNKYKTVRIRFVFNSVYMYIYIYILCISTAM